MFNLPKKTFLIRFWGGQYAHLTAYQKASWMGSIRRHNVAPCKSNIVFSWTDFSALPTLKICVRKRACALQKNTYGPEKLWSAPALPTCLATLRMLYLIYNWYMDIAYAISDANSVFFLLYTHKSCKKRLPISLYTTYLYYVQASLRRTSNKTS